MQIPQRRSQLQKRQLDTSDSGPEYLTAEGVEKLKQTLVYLEKMERPKIVIDLQFGLSLGDFSENAEYQDAKMRLSRIDGRIFGLKEKLKRAVVIEKSESSNIQLGSTVTVEANGKEKTYHIVGPRESNPAQGRISHVSPLGVALLGRTVGEVVEVETPNGTIPYRIIGIS